MREGDRLLAGYIAITIGGAVAWLVAASLWPQAVAHLDNLWVHGAVMLFVFGGGLFVMLERFRGV